MSNSYKQTCNSVNRENARASYKEACSRAGMLKPDRLRDLMAERGISQSELGRRVGVSQSAIFGLVSGSTYGSKHLHVIARVLETTPAYLTGEIDDASAGATVPPTAEQLADHFDLVPIASIDLAYGMGATYADAPFEEEHLHFPRSWVEAITSTPPELLTFVTGRGDSMTPTIGDGDTILIDRSKRRPLDQDDIWALTVGDVGMIKRIRIRGTNVKILSDNGEVPVDEVEMRDVHFVGRVIFIGRKR